MIATPVFTAVIDLRSPHKRNGSVRTLYKKAPKTVHTMTEALCWYYDKVQIHGKGNKRLIEIRQS